MNHCRGKSAHFFFTSRSQHPLRTMRQRQYALAREQPLFLQAENVF
jgi:hypothetical protein